MVFEFFFVAPTSRGLWRFFKSSFKHSYPAGRCVAVTHRRITQSRLCDLLSGFVISFERVLCCGVDLKTIRAYSSAPSVNECWQPPSSRVHKMYSKTLILRNFFWFVCTFFRIPSWEFGVLESKRSSRCEMKLLNVLPALERFSVQPVWRQCRWAKESLTRQKLKRPRKARRRGNAKGRNIVCVTLIYERISGL